MKPFKKILIIFGIVLSILVPLGVIIYHLILPWAYVGDGYRIVEERLNKLPSDILIKKVRNITTLGVDKCIIWGILINRKDERAIQILLKELKSQNENIRIGAIMSLADIGDKRAIEPLMNIVKSAKIDPDYKGVPIPDYIVALRALAKMKYEPVYHYAVEFATRKDLSKYYIGEAINMLESFGNPESIPLLKKIAEEDPTWPLHDGALKAIKAIESAQQAR